MPLELVKPIANRADRKASVSATQPRYDYVTTVGTNRTGAGNPAPAAPQVANALKHLTL